MKRWFFKRHRQDNSQGKNQEQQEEQAKQDKNEVNSQTFPKQWRHVSFHLEDLILGNPSQGVTIRSLVRNTCEHTVFIS